MKMFKRIVVLTGAGISAESGVPTFRGAGGLWHGRKVEDVATIDALHRDWWGVNAFFNGLRSFIQKIDPNPAHKALARLEEEWGDDFLLVTQNVDPLHDRAGSKNLIHMHGELLSVLCASCHGQSRFEGDVKEETVCPKCHQAGGLRPDIVLFGEIPYQMDRIMRAVSECDLFVAVGTSGAVYPAAGLVDVANQGAAHTVEINPFDTARSSSFQERLTGNAGDILPDFVEQLCIKCCKG